MLTEYLGENNDEKNDVDYRKQLLVQFSNQLTLVKGLRKKNHLLVPIPD